MTLLYLHEELCIEAVLKQGAWALAVLSSFFESGTLHFADADEASCRTSLWIYSRLEAKFQF